MQEKESIISVRYGLTNLSLWSLVLYHSAEPRDAKPVTFETDLSVRTSHSCQILIFCQMLEWAERLTPSDSTGSMFFIEQTACDPVAVEDDTAAFLVKGQKN